MLKYSVPCPGLIPVPVPNGGGPECDIGPPLLPPPCVPLPQHVFVLDYYFGVMANYVGVPGPTPSGHLVIEAEPLYPAIHGGVWPIHGGVWPIPSPFCLSSKAITTVKVRGAIGTVVDCPQSSENYNGGHVMLPWVRHGVKYSVSLHAWTTLNQRLDYLIAEHISYVGS